MKLRCINPGPYSDLKRNEYYQILSGNKHTEFVTIKTSTGRITECWPRRFYWPKNRLEDRT